MRKRVFLCEALGKTNARSMSVGVHGTEHIYPQSVPKNLQSASAGIQRLCFFQKASARRIGLSDQQK
jgi:hypothetical protein